MYRGKYLEQPNYMMRNSDNLLVQYQLVLSRYIASRNRPSDLRKKYS